MQEQTLYIVKVAPGLEYECIAPDKDLYAINEKVLISCERFSDIGMIMRTVELPTEEQLQQEIVSDDEDSRHLRKIEGNQRPTIERHANDHDQELVIANNQLTDQYLKTANNMAKRNHLEMKFINAHCSYDNRLIIFQFTSEGRVDFRQLLRDLSENIHSRVELRQVGVRDETTILGGVAPCGRVLCCSGFINNFVSINVKMAKEQGLSLNPTNISGVCGRLKCCLAFEYEEYKERRLNPQKNLNSQIPDSECDCKCNCQNAKESKDDKKKASCSNYCRKNKK